MKYKAFVLALSTCTYPLYANQQAQLERDIAALQKQSEAMQLQVKQLKKQLDKATVHKSAVSAQTATNEAKTQRTKSKSKVSQPFHIANVEVHALSEQPESKGFYPTALVADGHVVTYIAGTPVVSAPYLGSRPAFDGSDYIVNISSINRDIRLMQQRRSLYQAYESIGYKAPVMPLIALSGKVEPSAYLNRPYLGNTTGDVSLGSNELDVAAAVNRDVEAYMSLAYGVRPFDQSGTRVDRSALFLNMGFVNIGDLEKTPFYFTAGQLFVPFGRYSSAMISSPLTMVLARTKSRPIILGYKSQQASGPYAAFYGFKSETTEGKSGVGGVNLGYSFAPNKDWSGEVGASYIGTIADSSGMQYNEAGSGNTFAGFASPTNGSEAVSKVPGAGVHAYVNYDKYSLTAEWVAASHAFRPQDLSMNGQGAMPQALQLEAGLTFVNFSKPASFSVGYQWSKDALALLMPKQSVNAVYNISIWKDTVESIEYRHDIDYAQTQFANGAAPIGVINTPIYGTGRASDTLLAQIGVYF